MRILGLDFTSAPSPRKPLIAVGCAFDGGILRPESAEEMTMFATFEEFLRKPGPWVCGMDFPFGQPRSLVQALGWPEGWEGYVGEVARLSREEFEDAIRSDMATRPYGSKWRYRGTDRLSGSSSAMMLFRVPVGKMFFRGAPRLLRSGISVQPCRPTGDDRVAVEAYPAVVARAFLDRASYKRDGEPDTPGRLAARRTLVAGLGSPALRRKYGFGVKLDAGWRNEFIGDPSADALDSLLCAVQAAWAYTRRDNGWGVPEDCDRDEGWIVDPTCSTRRRRRMPMQYGSRFEEALIYASRVHAGQMRKGTETPYITHLLAVAAIVGENGGTEDQTTAALLHDAPEDQGGKHRLEEIRARFGNEVADIVEACSDTFEDPKPPWRERKEAYIARIRTESESARLVSAADKLHNARSILSDYRELGEDLWVRFKGGRDGTLWYYDGLLEAFRETGTAPQVVDELRRTVNALKSLAGV